MKKKGQKLIAAAEDTGEAVYLEFVRATVAYAYHPDTPRVVSKPLVNALAAIRLELEMRQDRRENKYQFPAFLPPEL